MLIEGRRPAFQVINMPEGTQPHQRGVDLAQGQVSPQG